VDREIVETYAFDHGGQRAPMASGESGIEGAHEVCLLQALAFAESHAGVEVPDVPAIGDRHVAGIGPAVNDDDTVFAKQAVIAGVVDETRDEEFRLRPHLEISADRGAIVYPGEPDAGMRTQRPDNDRKFDVSR